MSLPSSKTVRAYLLCLVQSPKIFGWHSKPFLQFYLDRHILKFISEELLSFLPSHIWDFPITFAPLPLYFSYLHVSRHPFDSLHSWRMKALSNLSFYFLGYLAEGMSYKNCSKWPKWIRALPLLLLVIRLSKASGSWITQSRCTLQ